MKVKEFKTMEEFEKYFESDCYNELVPTVITENCYYKVDFTTHCKSWKTAIRRAKKAFSEYVDIVVWLDGIEDSCSHGCFNCDEKNDGGWFFGVEEVSDGVWYIYISFLYRNPVETSEAEEAEETEEAAEAEETKCKETEESTASKETYSTETAGSAKRKTDNQTYNSMCYNCKKFLNGCRGEKNKIYSGCVYKEKMEVRNNG